MATEKGLEPSTSGVTGRHSNQLNYRTNAGRFAESGCKYKSFFTICKHEYRFILYIFATVIERVEMKAQLIDLSEWGYFGEGGSSTSYTKKVGENLVLKLNNRDIPVEITENEYLASKAFHEAGFPSPAIFDFVTDGERFGYTSQRINGKQSFARLLSQETGSAERLARRFAALARDLHGTAADATKMSSARERLLKSIGDLSFVPEDVAAAVRKCFSSIGDDAMCLHGDMNPGNIISFEDRDNWIGVNEFAYGDPFLDIATMHIICYFLPAKYVKRLYHAGQSQLRLFFTFFKKAYFGNGWDSKEVEARIWDAATVKFCAAAATKPEFVSLLIPLVRRNRLGFLFRSATFKDRLPVRK